MQAEIARISRLVDDLLLLAKTEQTEFLRIESIDLPVYVRELWDGVEPARQPPLRARRRFRRGRSAPIPTASHRRCAT